VPASQPKESKGDASSSGSRSTTDNVRNSRESLLQLEEVLSHAGSSKSASTVESLEDGDVRLSQVFLLL